jgi:hypothetical protein
MTISHDLPSCIKPPFYDTVSVLEIYVHATIFLIIFPPRIVKVPFPIGILKSKKKIPTKKSAPHGVGRRKGAKELVVIWAYSVDLVLLV